MGTHSPESMQFYEHHVPSAENADPFQRKRSRDVLDDDSDECSPISKRINCLHLEYMGSGGGGDHHSSFPTASQSSPLGPGTAHQFYPDMPTLSEIPHSAPTATYVPSMTEGLRPHLGEIPGRCSYGGPYPADGCYSPRPHEVPQGCASPGVYVMDGANGRMPSSPELFPGQGGFERGQVTEGLMGYGALEGYRPELTEMENPYYYHINQVLHDAHVARSQRFKSS